MNSNKQCSVINILREVINLIVSFFKPVGIKDKTFKISNSLKNLKIKIGIIESIETVIMLSFAFLLTVANNLIESKQIIIGIVVFMIYIGRGIIRESISLYLSNENQKYDILFENELVYTGSKIIGLVANKVLKEDKERGIFSIMSNESVLNSIRRYICALWEIRLEFFFELFNIISTLIMLVIACVTNTKIPQTIFIPLIVIFAILNFVISAYISLHNKTFREKRRKLDDEQYVISNDLLRVPAIVEEDVKMRLEKYQNVMKSNRNINVKFHKKQNLSYWVLSAIELLSQYGIIIFYVLGIGTSNITLGTIASITANLIIIETSLSYIRRIARTLCGANKRKIMLNSENEDFNRILEVYYGEKEKTNKVKVVEDICIPQLKLNYIVESENDIPFSLQINNPIKISKGDIAILKGVSGSGKSTFMKLITERIKVEKTAEIPSTSRYLFYDEKLKFGSLSLYEELFAGTVPNEEKMEEILKNLHLYSEITENCVDIWKWLKEKKFDTALSNGQRQRLILAKILYFISDKIDVVVLDECTSGLDDKSVEDSADAIRVLEYIVRYCNQDKKRTIVISTHQNIEEFEIKMAKEFVIKEFEFLKQNGISTVKMLSK